MSRKNSESLPKLPSRFRLGTCLFSTETAELHDHGGTPIHLRSQSLDVLAHLLRHNGQIVAKIDLFEAVWPGTSVTDDSLVQCISEIRRSLGDSDHRLIQTIARRGYKANAEPAPAIPPQPPTKQPSIAVLAFDDYSSGPDSNYLSDAIPEGIIAELSKFPELLVIARNSSFAFRDAATDVQLISRKLNCRYVLEGSQQKIGHRLRGTAQLIDAQTGHHLWAQTYDRDLDDLFAVQDDILRQVVASVAHKLIKSEARRSSTDPDQRRTAVLHHFQARQHLIRFTAEATEQARLANLAAIRADPDQPFGHAGLAFVHLHNYRWGWGELPPDQALTQARQAAQTALDLDPDYYDGHAAMACVHLQENELDRAITRAGRALELNPNDTNIMCDLADFLAYAGRTDEAEQLLQKAMRLDPMHPDWFRWNMAWIQWLKGNNDAALHSLNAMSDIPPMAYHVLILVHMGLGNVPKARKALQDLLDHDAAFCLAKIRRTYQGKFRNPADFDRVMDTMRAAGLPE